MLEKIKEWLAAGTRLVWIVDPPRQRVHIHSPVRPARTLALQDTRDGEDVLPGLKLPVAEIFR
jgi:Uma2 family endonuclease